MAYDFDIEKIQDEVQSMCETHVEIAHNVNGRKTFARFESNDQVNDIKKSAGDIAVVVASVTARRVGQKDDRSLQREMILRIVKFAASTGNVTASKNQAIKKAEEILFDLWTKMEKKQEDDIDNDIACSLWRFLRCEDMFFEEVEDQPWLINHYGYDLHVIFRTPMPSYNPDKWIN